MNIRLIYALVLLLFALSACTDNGYEKEELGDGWVRLKAGVADNKQLTRAGETEPATEGTYYLYYTPVIATAETDANGMNVHLFECDKDGDFTANPPLHWDDIKREGADATFYLTNTETMTFSPKKKDEDILFGKATGWNEVLDFTLAHLTAKVSVVLWDNTLNRDNEKKVNFSNAKVVFYPGLTQKTKGIDYENGKILFDVADKEDETTIDRSKFGTEGIITIEGRGDYNAVASTALHIAPLTFANTDSLEITAGEYVYRIPVPSQNLTDSREVKAGEHLVIYIELTEDEAKLKATLLEWDDTVNLKPINVSRVFNISNWYELRDLMQAINTGYTFEGMVVRLTKDIEIGGQVTLGTEKYPFKGIFDGNGKIIKNLGNYLAEGTSPRNSGGFFGYTEGATLQNITLEEAFVESDESGATGSLVNTAQNTTIFNCRLTVGENVTRGAGVQGKGDNVGGMVGIATGTSTLINCYSSVAVVVTGASQYVGGLIGYSEAAITHSYATGQIAADDAFFVGGLGGYQTGVILNCYAQGEVKGQSQVGGLIGYLDGGASYCYASGTVAGTTDKGGLFGNVGFDGVPEKCFWLSNNDYGGAGSADLSKTCTFFANQTQLLGEDYLNDPGPVYSIWKPGDVYPVFVYE